MASSDTAPALLDLIAEQQSTIITLRKELQAAKDRAEQYRSWWLEEQEKVTNLLNKTTSDNA